MVTIKDMISLLIAVFACWRAFLVPQHRLALEIMALRQQFAVFKRKQPRPKLQRQDWLFWVALRHMWWLHCEISSEAKKAR